MKILLTLCCLLLATPAWSATYYVRAGAGGSNNGADWTNAYTSMPSLGAGNTYYMAEGSYGSVTVSAANVTIKKCPSSAVLADACQSVSGWNNTYGDGQASFGEFNVQAAGFTLDGQTRNESNWADGTAYGFRISGGGIRTSTFDNPGNICPANVTIRYLNAGGTEGSTPQGSDVDTVIYVGGFQQSCTGWTISRSYLHNASHYTIIQFAGANGITVEYTRLQNSWGKEAIRGQIVAANLIIRYNQFYNACGDGGAAGEGCTAEIALWDGSNFSGNQIYGNWFYRSNGDLSSGGTIVVGGNGSSWVGPSASNTLVYNNTIAGFTGGWYIGMILVNGGSGNVCRNNLWYQVAVASATCNTTSNNVNASSNPFVNYAGADLHLTGATTAGYTLSSPYNVDMDGTTRGAGGVWDVGAYEYPSGGGASPPVGTPTLSVRSLVWWIILPIGAFAGLITMLSSLVGILARRTFDGRSDRMGGVGDVGGGQGVPPLRPATAGVVQEVRRDQQPGGSPLDEPSVVANEPANVAAAHGSQTVMR